MIHIERLPKPNILLEKEHEWTDKFIHSGKTRPDNTKYGHKTILQTLQSMSFTKCFYCEQKLTGVASEIDHLIEVNIEKKQAYSWENLYLSCENCNHKINHLSISIHDVLIPCKDHCAKPFSKRFENNTKIQVGYRTFGLFTYVCA
jgi:uncharacterized protein (TIGR02646 family)